MEEDNKTNHLVPDIIVLSYVKNHSLARPHMSKYFVMLYQLNDKISIFMAMFLAKQKISFVVIDMDIKS